MILKDKYIDTNIAIIVKNIVIKYQYNNGIAPTESLYISSNQNNEI
jgi:hypothetical protein